MADQKLTERGALSTSTDNDSIHVVNAGISYKQTKANFLKEDRDRLDNLEENQYSGVVVYSTLASLPATGTANVSYKVTNDSTSSNNGYYHWNGSAYIKDADLVLNAIDTTNTSDGVSGRAVGDNISKNLFFKYNTDETKLRLSCILDIKFTNIETPDTIKDVNGDYEDLYITDIFNTPSFQIIRVHNSGGRVCQIYETIAQKSGISTVTLSEYLSSGISMEMTVDWDVIPNYFVQNTTEIVLNTELIASRSEKFKYLSSLPNPYTISNELNYNSSIYPYIDISEFEIYYTSPDKAYNSNGEKRQFYIDYLRNTTSFFIRLQEVGNVTANGACYWLASPQQTGVQTMFLKERYESGISVLLTIDTDLLIGKDFYSLTSSQTTISDDVINESIQSSERLGIEKVITNNFPNALDNAPNFKTKLLSQNDDVEIIFIGDSLLAKTDLAKDLSTKSNLPPSCTNGNTFYNIWNNIVKNKPVYDRYDTTVNTFSEVGTWATSKALWESPSWTGEFRENGSYTRYSTTANATVSFAWDLDTYEKLNFIHRKGINGCQVVTMTIAEGNGKAEVLNDVGSWVEANGYVFTQYINPATATEGSGYSQYLGNWRMKMRAVGTGTATITISKGNNAERLYYWGTEQYNGVTILMTNLARAGKTIQTFKDNLLNDIYDRNPDLILFEVPLTNEININYADEQGIYDDLEDLVWGDRVGFEFANSFLNTSIETILLIPHYSSDYFSGNSPLTLTGGFTAPNVFNRTKNLINTKGNVGLIDLSNIWILEGRKRNRNIEETSTYATPESTDSIFERIHTLKSFVYDGVHQNTNGARLWGEYISSIFNDII